MKIKLKKLTLENFKGTKNLVIEFGNVTNCYGANATGKTTITDAFFWLLFNRDSQGNTKFQIRPLDKKNKQIDNVEIKVAAILDVDGKEVELQKVQKQNWVKKRGSGTKIFSGNGNEYSLNTYPANEKEFKEYISNLIDEKMFSMVTNPKAFTSLDWKEQRKILFGLISDITDIDVANTDPSKFGQLIKEFNLGVSAEKIIEKVKITLTGLKKQQAEIPIRIDELSASIVDIDIAEQELAKNALLEQMAEIESKEDNLSKQYEEYEQAKDKIFNLKMELSEVERKANEGLIQERNSFEKEIRSTELAISSNKSLISSQKSIIGRLESEIGRGETERKNLGVKYNTANTLKFDENSLICSFCNQEYPDDKKEEIKAKFEQSKEDEKNRLINLGTLEKTAIEKCREDLKTAESEINAINDRIDTEEDERKKLEEELAKLPTTVDMTDNEEYQIMSKEIESLEKSIANIQSPTELRNSLKIQKKQLQEELANVEKIIMSADNSKTEERIEELRTEQREVAQKVADQEAKLFLLEEFTKAKMDMLSSKINSKFKTVNWKLFDVQINGGIKETCECTVNGIPYSDVNSGHKLIAGLDIIRTLQEMYGIGCPIWIDNAESISEGNLPEMDCQLITMSVSNDKKIRIEVV